MPTMAPDREPLPRERFEHGRVTLQDDERHWTLNAIEAREAARLRHAFRDYLETYGDASSDFDAAETVFGELIGNCARHAPGPVHIEFRWDAQTLVVVDACDRLRTWPFSPDDTREECTNHFYKILSALTGGVHVTRDHEGGTRASVVLPVMRARA